jgi:hypothetical protein
MPTTDPGDLTLVAGDDWRNADRHVPLRIEPFDRDGNTLHLTNASIAWTRFERRAD